MLHRFLKSALNTHLRHFSIMSEQLYYFGYGSNLLAERIHIQNPTAVFKEIARLDDYMLDFDCFTNRWQGAVATVTEAPGAHTWGVVWALDQSQLHHLDDQEGVHAQTYKPIEVQVETPSGEKLTCRTYYLLKRGFDDKRPSPQYLDVIIRGAIEHSLPEEYIDKLKHIESNGYSGEIGVNIKTCCTK